MALVIDVRFIAGAFDAASPDDASEIEWPPHPARLFNALVAASFESFPDEDRFTEALRWLEAQPAPAIRADHTDAVWWAERDKFRRAYVATNEVTKPGHATYPARTAQGPRVWTRAHPEHDRVAFVWPDAPVDIANDLDRLCRAVPYLGRSTSPVVAEITTEVPLELDEHNPMDGASGAQLSVPYPGYLDALNRVFQRNAQPWEAPRRWSGYAQDQPVEAESAVARPSAYDQLIILAFEGRRRPPASATVRLTAALRKAVMRYLDGGPTALHGHIDDAAGAIGERYDQVSFLGLPFVGDEHADGRLLGLGVALPVSLEASARRAILRALADIREVWALDQAPLPLSAQRSSRATLQPERWIGPRHEWVSALPMVPDRFPKRPGDREAAVRAACIHAGLPEPIEIETSLQSFLTGAPQLRPNQTQRKASDRPRPSFHVRLRFENPIRGPVVLGNMRHYGLGLCLPVRGERS